MMPFRFTVRVLPVDIAPAQSQQIIQATESISNLVLLSRDRSGQGPLAYVEANVPEIVIVEVNGAQWQRTCELIQQIRLISPHTQVVVITNEMHPERTFAALQAGALGYIDEQRIAQSIIPAFQAVVRERGFLDPVIARFILQNCSQSTEQQAEITDREYSILRAFNQGDMQREVQKHLHIPADELQRHIGNILLKIALPASDTMKQRAYQEIERSLQSPRKPRRKKLKPWMILAIFRASYHLQQGGNRYHPKPFIWFPGFKMPHTPFSSLL
ncbi:MAG TPA: hypothetical protein VH593_26820 [Ktedonobacteraceae bacterium]